MRCQIILLRFKRNEVKRGALITGIAVVLLIIGIPVMKNRGLSIRAAPQKRKLKSILSELKRLLIRLMKELRLSASICPGPNNDALKLQFM
jgi:hypothetical protein